LREIQQKPKEPEDAYATRLRTQHLRCVQYLTPHDLILRFIDGLDPAIRRIIHRYYQATKQATMQEVIHEAMVEGESIREQKGITAQHVNPQRGQQTMAIDAKPTGSHWMPGAPQILAIDDQASSVVTGPPSFPPTLTGTSSNTFTLDIHQEPMVAAINSPRTMPPLRRPNMPNQGPGWEITTPSNMNSIICRRCYLPGHIYARCNTNIHENRDRIIEAYHGHILQTRGMLHPGAYWELHQLQYLIWSRLIFRVKFSRKTAINLDQINSESRLILKYTRKGNNELRSGI